MQLAYIQKVWVILYAINYSMLLILKLSEEGISVV